MSFVSFTLAQKLFLLKTEVFCLQCFDTVDWASERASGM